VWQPFPEYRWVLFRDYRKTTGMFWGVGLTRKTVSELEVIETENYKLD
jgi:hypothetical protein